MEIIFTKHALERIDEREIRFAEIIQCLASPTKIDFSEERTVYYKLDYNKQYLLILVCSINTNSCKIITVIKTSQIKKYLDE